MPQNPFLALAGATININSKMLSAVLAFFLLIFVVVSVMLAYHWKTYGMGNKKIVFARNIYFSVSAIIISVAILSITTF